MVIMDGNNLGDRLRAQRGRLYTQQQLADRAGVSVGIVRNLEQGNRNRASLASLHALADALDVSLADLLGPTTIPEQAPDEGALALRRAVNSVHDLLPGSEPDEPLSAREAQRSLTYVWGTYWAGRYEDVAALLPATLSQLHATLTASNSSQVGHAHEWLARAYWVAGCTLVHLRYSDAAFQAVRRAITHADQADDALLAATLRGSLSWQLLVSGRYRESEQLCLSAASGIEPAGAVELPHLSAYGSLVLTAATAAARDQRSARAAELVSTSADVAHRMDGDRDDYQTAFGPSQVAMQSVDVGVQTQEFSRAVSAARAMPNQAAALPLASRARHLVDRAVAHTHLGQHEPAANLVTAAEAMAPQWARHQSLLRSVTGDLLRTRRSSQVRPLAHRLGVR